MTETLSIAAVVIAALGLLYAHRANRIAGRSASAAEAAAKAAEAADRRERTPLLGIDLPVPAPHPVDRVIYCVRSEGPQDLDSLVVYRPRPPDRITYPIARTGSGPGWADDEVELGPLRLGEEARFTLCCGAAPELPELRVRIECRSGNDEWSLTQVLPPPRGPVAPVPVAEIRPKVEKVRALFQDITAAGGHDASFFLDDDRKGVGQGVRDCAERSSDAPLRGHLTDIATLWDQAFGHAPPEQGPRICDLNQRSPGEEYRCEDLEFDRRRGLEAEAASQGLESCAKALARLTELERLQGH